MCAYALLNMVTIVHCRRSSLQIPEVRLLLSRAAYLVTTLRSLHSKLTMVAEDDSVTWNDLSSQVHQCKVLKLLWFCTVPYSG